MNLNGLNNITKDYFCNILWGSTNQNNIGKLEDIQIRSILEKIGFIPSTEEAKNKFWSLGDNWWKQIIDGKDHKWGKEVYDKGLHGGHIEPGFLKGIEDASLHLSDHFDNLLDFNLYEKTHHIACKHFKGKENDTLMMLEEVDKLRTKPSHVRCVFTDSSDKEAVEAYEKKYVRALHLSEWPSHVDDLLEKGFISETKAEELKKSVSQEQMILAKKEADDMQLLRQQFVNTLKSELDVFIQKYGIPGKFGINSAISLLDLHYVNIDSKIMKDVVSNIFIDYEKNLLGIQKESIININKTINTLNETCFEEEIIKIKKQYQDKVIVLCATIYAELEWLHPWIDGQGRTDLLILSWLLTRDGLHPALLDKPYYSSSHSIAEWKIYLEKGLNEWETLR